METEEYKDALRQTNMYLKNSVGFSIHDPAGESDKIIIRQNNTLIHLLIQVHKKIDLLLNNTAKAKEDESHIEGLIGQLQDLNLEKVKPAKPRETFYTFGITK